MATKSKSDDERTAATAMKELRARDAAAAMREYRQEQQAVLARTERLRALRLSRDSRAASGAQQAPTTGKRPAARPRSR